MRPSQSNRLIQLLILATGAVALIVIITPGAVEGQQPNDVHKPIKAYAFGKKPFYMKSQHFKPMHVFSAPSPNPTGFSSDYPSLYTHRVLNVMPQWTRRAHQRPFATATVNKPVVAPSNVQPARDVHSPTSSESSTAIDWSSDDMMQRPIDEVAPRRSDRTLGDACTYSRDCGSGCCLLNRETNQRACQPKAMFAERCSSAQVKGDLYVDACPCASGVDFCALRGPGICSA